MNQPLILPEKPSLDKVKKSQELVKELGVINYTRLKELANKKTIYTKTTLLEVFKKNSPVLELVSDEIPQLPTKTQFRKLRLDATNLNRMFQNLKLFLEGGVFDYVDLKKGKLVIYHDISKNAFVHKYYSVRTKLVNPVILHFYGGRFKNGFIINTLIIKEELVARDTYMPLKFEVVSHWVVPDKFVVSVSSSKVKLKDFIKLHKKALEFEVIRQFDKNKYFEIVSKYTRRTNSLEKNFEEKVRKEFNEFSVSDAPALLQERNTLIDIIMRNVHTERNVPTVVINYILVNDYNNPEFNLGLPSGLDKFVREYSTLLNKQFELLKKVINILANERVCSEVYAFEVTIRSGFSNTSMNLVIKKHFNKIEKVSITGSAVDYDGVIKKLKNIVAKHYYS